MGISLCVATVKIFSVEDKFADNQELKISDSMQRNICDASGECLPVAESIVTIKAKDDKKSKYSVVHYSDIIDKTARFIWSRHIEYADKYQEKVKFDVIHDKENDELFIATNKAMADQFIKRLNTCKFAQIRRREFNLDIQKIKEILNVYGIWDRVDRGNVKCEAKFGIDVLDAHSGELIAISMHVNINGKEFDLTISKKGQISSHSKLAKIEDLIYFYHKIKSELVNT